MKRSVDLIKGVLVVFLLLAGQSACQQHLEKIGNVGPLPEEEIVFQTIVDTINFGGSEQRRLGFVTPQGVVFYSDLNQIRMPFPVYPMYTTDNELLVFNAPFGRGYMATADVDGNTARFSRYPKGVYERVTPITDTHEAIIVTMDSGGRNSVYSLRRMDLHTGKILETYLTTQPDGNIDPFLQIGTRVQDGQRLLFMRHYGVPRHYTFVLLDTETWQETIVLDSVVEISAPAFSPDGRWIAYGGEDGVYVLEPDADEIVPRKVVTATNSVSEQISPAWSPDGEWLVYHDCLRGCNKYTPPEIEDFNIYKVNVATGERVLLVEGGLNPYWRLNPP